MYVERKIADKLKSLATRFPVVFLTGPRQSGKSTVLRHAFPDYNYVNLEEVDTREFAREDPRGFLNRHAGRTIIDEAQRAPDLFSYIQARVDETNASRMYILSGSQNFLMLRNISQSLAGRVGILTLLPFSLAEAAAAGSSPATLNEWLYRGGYPRLLTGNIAPEDFFPAYIQTYVERDIRAEVRVHDLARFQTFIRICATRTGTPLNMAKIGAEVSADARTVSSWLSILEESYLVFRAPAWHRNITKRQVKSFKLYFYDTGLLCALLGITPIEALAANSLRGYIFENAGMVELAKNRFNTGRRPAFFYYREANYRDKEIDLIVEEAGRLALFEIKAAATANAKFAGNINAFAAMLPDVPTAGHVVYDGPEGMRAGGVEFLNWRELAR